MSNVFEGIPYVPNDMLASNGISSLDGMTSGWANGMKFNACPTNLFGLSNNQDALDGVQSSTNQDTLDESATGVSSPDEAQAVPPVEKQTRRFYMPYLDRPRLFGAPADHAALSHGHGHGNYSLRGQLHENQRVATAQGEPDQSNADCPTEDEDKEITFVQGQLDPALAESHGMASTADIFQGQESSELYFFPNDHTHRYGMGLNSYHFPRLIHDAASAYNSPYDGSPPGSLGQHEESPNNNDPLTYTESDCDRSDSPPMHDQPLTFMEPDAPDFVPKMSEILNADFNDADTNTLFASAEEANQFEHEDIPDDVTVPRTKQQQRAVVKALFNAVKNTENAQDNPGMIKPFVEGKYSDRRIEILCWNIMHTCAVRHTRGSLLVPFELKRKQTAEMHTYAERMSKIIECLMTQKTICKHLLDPYYLFQFIDDPVASQKRVVANKNLNKRKGHIMNAGKKIFGKSSPASSSPQTRLEESFASETPSSTRPSYGMTPSSNRDDPDRTITPDGSFIETRRMRNLASSAASSPSARRISLNRGVSGATPYQMPHNLPKPTSSHHSSPSPAPKPGVFMDHIRRFHTRRLSGSVTPSRSRGEAPHTPSHSRNASADSSVAANSFVYDGIQHHPMIPGGTPTERPRSDSASTSSSDRKRSFSEVDEAEDCSSPEKKQR